MPCSRGTSNSNARGNTKNRLARREYLIRTYQSNKAEGTARCYRCGKLLTVDTVTVDRVIPGCKGGTYRRDNIRPACLGCNASTGAKLATKK